MRVGVVGGTGLYTLGGDVVRVDTIDGGVEVEVADLGGARAFFVARHGRRHEVGPQAVRHRANALALAACRVERVLAVHNVGALAPGFAFLVPDDVLDRSGRAATLFGDRAVHVPFAPPYCPETRAALAAAARATGRATRDGGVLAVTAGPRFESPAEARHLAERAAAVSMTAMPEAAVFREAGLCFAALCVAVNDATAPPDAQSVQADFEAFRADVLRALADAVARLPARRGCACGSARANADLLLSR